MPEPAEARYVMGHTDRERRRLTLQGAILNPITESFLRRAGIAEGMHTLDIGCGVGEVAILAGRLVGARGRVTAVDIDEAALAIAESRAREQGLANVSFVRARLEDFKPEHLFDAVIGRHILIHTADPLAIVQTAWRNVRWGGVAAFQEFDFSVVHQAYPVRPLGDRLMQVFRDFFWTATHGNIGTRLFHLLLDAGFATPSCRAEYPLDGGPDSPFYEWMAEALRSIYPRVKGLGIEIPFDLDLDTLADRLRAEAVALNACCPSPAMVGAFARKH
ncbi:MAG TPA: class I SAM-dependent methyltransferase [Bryobacteraceae bacterium]|jgi:SAM-dependent methyltransferase